MDAKFLSPTAPYEEVTAALKASEEALIKTCMNSMQSSPAFSVGNIYGWGVGRRAISLSSGYRAMVEQTNSLCAMPMVRMQLDTTLRLYAGFFAPNSLDFAEAVLSGEQIDRIKSDTGERMRDKYLLDRVAKRNPWMTDVYKLTSGYIHFSNKHLKEVFDIKEDGNLKVVIGPNDYNREPKHFHEPSRCMHHLNLIIDVALSDWFDRMCGPGSPSSI